MKFGRYLIAAATAACLILGIVSIVHFVGWERLNATTESGPHTPIAFDDHALQFYYGQLGARNLVERGVTYGYDPSFMAGYPKSPIYYPSSKPYEFSLALFSRFDPGAVFDWTVFAMLAALPFLIFGAARNFGLSSGETLVAVALSLVPQILTPMVGFYSIMEAAGMAPFIFACFLSVFVVSLVFRFLSEGHRGAGIALFVAAPLLYLSHLTAIPLSLLPIATIYLMRLRTTPVSRHIWLWLLAVTIFAVNWPWIKGYLLFAHYADLQDFYTPEGSSHFAPPGGWLAPFHVIVAAPKLLSLTPPLFGSIGIYLWWRERNHKMLTIFVPQIVLLFVVCFYGVQLGLSAIAPARLTLPLALYLFFPAAHAIATGASKAVLWSRPLREMGRGGEALVVVVAVALLGLGVMSVHPKFLRPYSIPKLEAREGFTRHGMAFIAWLRKHTDSKGRILHEETDRSSHQYFGSHMPAWIPLYSGREFAGGPAPHALVQHNFLRFIAGRFRGIPLAEVGDERLASYLDLYNVRWLVAWKPSTKQYLDPLALAERVAEYEHFTLYRIAGPASFFLQGSGKIQLKGSRIQLRNVVSEDGAITIKYHWLETLKTDPPREIRPIHQLDDPVPYISILNPPKHFTIYDTTNAQ